MIDGEAGIDIPPLVFWLIAGYFYSKPERFDAEGLFRVTSSDSKVRELEHHMSKGNYAYLADEEKVDDPHVVANYLKRLLRESRQPLIPQVQLEALGKEGADIKAIIQQLPHLNKNILQLLLRFFE